MRTARTVTRFISAVFQHLVSALLLAVLAALALRQLCADRQRLIHLALFFNETACFVGPSSISVGEARIGILEFYIKYMSEKHLSRYVSEFSGRHNVRERDTDKQMEKILRTLEGKILRYYDLVGAC